MPTLFVYTDNTTSTSTDTVLTSASYGNRTDVLIVVVGTEVTSIGNDCFYQKGSLVAVSFSSPSFVTSIGNNALAECTALGSCALPSSVTTIGDYGIAYCYILSSVGDISSVTSIGVGAFSGSGISSIVIPTGLTTISNSAFSDCSLLANVTFAAPSTCATIVAGAFARCSALKSISLPSSVTEIQNNAFQQTGLISIDVSTVSTLGGGAFLASTSLASVTLSPALTVLPNELFIQCSALTAITIPANVSTLGDSVFNSCSALSTVYWLNQSNFTTYGSGIFASCNAMYVYFNGVSNYNALSNTSKTFFFEYPSGSSFFYDIVPCFNQGTKILCLTADNKEEYLPIESLKEGETVVQTFQHGPRKISKLLHGTFQNDPSNVKKCMYRMCRTEDNHLTEDLYVTGLHGILVDKVSLQEEEMQQKMWGKPVRGFDGKEMVLACASKHFEPVSDVGKDFTYYHFTVENDGDDNRQFGVFANGLLTETPSAHQMNMLTRATHQ